jgi:phenylpyruvate tautomerase PptA (4-oxalocrotonate tautomerase family)
VPTISLTTAPEALDVDVVPALLEQLGDIVRRAERMPDDDLFKANTWSWHHQATLCSGGNAPRFLVRASVPQGALDAERTAELIREATEAVATAAGVADADRASVWVLVSEIDEGSWGIGGQVILFEQLRAQLRAQAPAGA